MKRITILFAAIAIAIAGMSLATAATPSANEDITVQELIKLLNEKGVLTDAETAELEKRVKKQTTEKSVRIGGNVQARYTLAQDDAAQQNTFGIKRARLFVRGNAFENTEFFVQGIFRLDGGANRNQLDLHDAKLSFKLSDRHKLHVGQFVVPFSREDLASDLTLHTIEKSRVVGRLAPNRDVGISLDGATHDKVLRYGIGLFNGEGKNPHPDTGNINDKYMFIGRLVAAPRTDKVKFEIGAGYGRNTTGAKGAAQTTVDLYTFDMLLAWRNSAFIGEYIHGKFNPVGAAAATKRNGFYLQYAYSFNPVCQAVIKYEEYDHDTSGETVNDEKWTTLGLNQYLRGSNLRLSYNYIFKSEGAPSINDDLFITQLQVRF